MKTKIISVIVYVTISLNVFSQKDVPYYTLPKMPIDKETNLISYDKTISITGTKQQLYDKTMAWIKTYYKNPHGIIKIQNPDSGIIECKPRFPYLGLKDKDGKQIKAGTAIYTIRFIFNENKIDVLATKFNIEKASFYPMEKFMDKNDQYYQVSFDYYLFQTDEYIKNLFNDMKKGIK